MTDVTARFASYRECVRHVWNAHVRPKEPGVPSVRLCEAFATVRRELLDAIVLAPLGVDLAEAADMPRRFVVVPKLHHMPILLNRSVPAAGYWDYPVTSVEKPAVRLGFLGFFDWDDYGSIDLQYVRVVVEDINGRSSPIDGRHGLVEWSSIEVELAPGSAATSPRL